MNKENKVGVELYINDSKEIFDDLFVNRDNIEFEFGAKMEWQRLDDRKASRIIYYIDGLNFEDHSNYKELDEQIISAVINMRRAFKKYL